MEPLFSLIKNTLNARIRNCSFIFSDVTRANKLTEKINPSDLSNSFILSSTYWIQYYCVCASFVLCGHMYTQTEQLRNSGWLMMAWYKKRSLRQGFVISVCVCVCFTVFGVVHYCNLFFGYSLKTNLLLLVVFFSQNVIPHFKNSLLFWSWEEAEICHNKWGVEHQIRIY